MGDIITEDQITELDNKSIVVYIREYLNHDEADIIFHHLLNHVNWRHSFMKGNDDVVYELPRLQCWMSNPGVVAQLYQKEPAMEWSNEVLTLKHKLEALLNCEFDYVLMNYYRDGKDKIGFHRDDEAEEEGKNTIASLSFGATRKFIIRHNKKKIKYPFNLCHGSLIVMMGDTQINWRHGIPEDLSIKVPRINLTFRKS